MAHRIPLTVLALLGSLTLAGCFGGGGDDVVVETPPVLADPLAAVPDTATQTVAGTVGYQQVLSLNSSETREPIDVTDLVLPSSETAEPVAVD